MRLMAFVVFSAAAVAFLSVSGASADPRSGDQGRPIAPLERNEISFAEFAARFGPKGPKGEIPPRPERVTLINRWSSECLDANPTQSWDGGQVYLWSCNGAEWQKWEFPMLDDRISFRAYDGLALDAVLNDNNGSAITRYHWRGWSDGGHWNQQWKFYSTGEIKSAWNGRCLDGDPAQAFNNPQRVWLWDCNGEEWQKWRVGPA